MRSFMNSMERLRTFWRLWRKSSAWWAKEKECSDSVGKRERSSEKLGDAGPAEKEESGAGAVTLALNDVERERVTTEGLRDEALEFGMVGLREGGCCRMRRRPESPRPCSWSVTGEGLHQVERNVSSGMMLSGDTA